MIDDTRKAELVRIQGMAVEHAIDEMDAAHKRGLDTKVDRGDRGFLTSMASRSMSVAVRIEQYLMLAQREQTPGSDDESEKAAHDRLIRESRAQVATIMKRIGSKAPAE